jgi:hypothetical protein
MPMEGMGLELNAGSLIVTLRAAEFWDRSKRIPIAFPDGMPVGKILIVTFWIVTALIREFAPTQIPYEQLLIVPFWIVIGYGFEPSGSPGKPPI